MPRRPRPVAVLLGTLLAVLSAVVLAGCGGGAAGSATTPAGSAAAAVSAGVAVVAPSEPTSGLPTVGVRELPASAVTVLGLIAAGGPFPYAKDGATFGNREGLLPARPSGFYAEYTVPKPGEDDRGPWRIVAGDDGSRFWTQDHYATFEEVVQ